MNLKQLTVCGAAFIALIGSPLKVSAIDPLPPHLENASLQEQSEYRASQAKESNEKRMVVARQRYKAREAQRQSLVTNIRARSVERREQILATVRQSHVAPAASTVSPSVGLGLCLAVAAAVAGLWLLRKKILKDYAAALAQVRRKSTSEPSNMPRTTAFVNDIRS